MQVSLDGTVKYCGHEIIKYRDGREFVNLSIVDGENKPYSIFCPGSVQYALEGIQFGQDITIVFGVSQWNNSLQLRAKEVIR